LIIRWLRAAAAARSKFAATTVVFMAVIGMAACDNSPNPVGSEKTNTLFTAFTERSPRYLDPTASYAINETPYMGSIYEPLYGYDYLKRPYALIPKTALRLVEPRYLDKDGRPLDRE
jgi:ABC-type transport system substrate-binding protein